MTSRVTPGGCGQCSVTLGGGGNRSRSWGEATLAAVLTTTARTDGETEGRGSCRFNPRRVGPWALFHSPQTQWDGLKASVKIS